MTVRKGKGQRFNRQTHSDCCMKKYYLRLDIHDDQVSIDSSLIFLVGHAEVTLKFLEELLHIVASDLESFEFGREAAPHILEVCYILLEAV